MLRIMISLWETIIGSLIFYYGKAIELIIEVKDAAKEVVTHIKPKKGPKINAKYFEILRLIQFLKKFLQINGVLLNRFQNMIEN